MTPKDPFLERTFWDKFWRPIRSRALLFTPELQNGFQIISSIISCVVAKHIMWTSDYIIIYKHPVLTLYEYGKFLTEGISLIF